MPSAVPRMTFPARNRRVILAKRPSGVPGPEHFEISEHQITKPSPGEMLIRNIYLSVDPAQRGWASDAANYSEPVPIGGPMRALAVGQVLESNADTFSAGDYVYGFFGWQDYATVSPAAVLHRCTENLPLEAFGSLCGINGVTAYLALTELGRPKAGDTLLVSTAGGSVGSFVGQIGKHLGCRTIGLTGSNEKVELCEARFGFDRALNYTNPDWPLQLAAAAPDGVDIYFDNTGGEILDTALRKMKVRGRVVQCGTASISAWNPPPSGPRNEREVLTRRLVWSGFVIFDHLDRYSEVCGTLAEMAVDGGLNWSTDKRVGLDHALSALQDLYAGGNYGKILILPV